MPEIDVTRLIGTIARRTKELNGKDKLPTNVVPVSVDGNATGEEEESNNRERPND